MRDIASELQQRDAEIAKLIRLQSEGAYYSLQNTHLTKDQKDIVEGWFQFPMHLQGLFAVVLAVSGIVWWEAILWSFIPSTALAIAIRRSGSSALGGLGDRFRLVVMLIIVAAGIYSAVESHWSIVALSAAHFIGLLGMGPAMLIMSASGTKWPPKYEFASRAFKIEFPFEAAERKLDEIRNSPLSEEHKEFLANKYAAKGTGE